MAGGNSHAKSYTCSLAIIVAMLVSFINFLCGCLNSLVFKHLVTKTHE